MRFPILIYRPFLIWFLFEKRLIFKCFNTFAVGLMKTVSATDHATHKVKITGIVIINIIQIILDVITNIFLSPFQSHGNHVQFCGWKSLTRCPIMMQVASGPYNVALYSHMFTL